MYILWFGGGFVLGMALVFYQVDAPKPSDCTLYQVKRQAAVSYVLRPPSVAPEVIHEKCPAPLKVEEAKAEPEPVAEEAPRRRHRRHRRHWR